MPRPRPGDWLQDEIRGLSQLGINTIVSLLETREEADLDLAAERSTAEALGLTFLSFPIPDRGVPKDARAFCAFATQVADHVRQGRGVVVHCRAGIGRSGLTAAGALVSLGHDPRDVFATLSTARGLPVPDTDEQLEWFGKHSNEFSRSTR